MGNAIRLLRLGAIDPIETQAVYHAVAERMHEGAEDTIIVTSPTGPCLCLGFHQIADEVLDRRAARSLSLPVLRRRVGGGLTYLDADQVFYQFVFHHGRVPAVPGQLYASLLRAPVVALQHLGLAASLERENEIEVGGKRIAGVGAARIGEASVVVGNVLQDFSYRTMAQVWNAPSAAFRALAAEALDERVTTLRREKVDVDLRIVEDMLCAALHEAFDRPVVLGALRPDEQAAMRANVELLTSEAFLDLHAGEVRGERGPLKISARAFVHAISDGGVRGALVVDEGAILRARLESDPPRDWTGAEARLAGRPASEWREVLQALDA
jgi:lipoate-protein ligase A